MSTKRYIRVTVQSVTETDIPGHVIPEFQHETMLINNYPVVIEDFAYEKHEKLDALIMKALAQLQ